MGLGLTTFRHGLERRLQMRLRSDNYRSSVVRELAGVRHDEGDDNQPVEQGRGNVRLAAILKNNNRY